MPETGETHILVFAEVSLDFLTLGGGFYDDEGATTGAGARGCGGGCGGGTRGCGGGSGDSRAGTRGIGRLDFELGRHCVCCNSYTKYAFNFILVCR